MYPEHTALAYREAAKQGADVIECDLAITKVTDKITLSPVTLTQERNEVEECEMFFSRI